MTNPGPPGGDERGLAADEPVVPEADPLLAADPLADPLAADPLAADPLAADVPAAPPGASPAPASFAPVSDSPVYDEVLSQTGEFATIGDTGGAVYGEIGETAGGPLGAVKTFAAQRPQVFLGVALAVGFLLGRVFSSSDDEES